MAAKFGGFEPVGFSRLGCNVVIAYNKVNPKPHNIAELKEILKDTWDKLPIDSIRHSVLGVQKCLKACVKADGGHFKHFSH